MSAEVAQRTVPPPAQSLDDAIELVGHTTDGPHIELVGAAGARVVLPDEVYAAVRLVILAMAAGQAVTIAPHNQTLTTQEAADLLEISRPTLVRLLERGHIPFTQPGQHRRVLLRDVLAYQESRRHERRAALDELTTVSEEAGLYDLTSTPIRTR